jgi:hypothetical protein
MGQLAGLPVTVYVVVVFGEAVTLAPLVELNPAEGLQLYEEAPLAINETLFPEQILALVVFNVTLPPLPVTLTVTKSVKLPLQPGEVTVYVVVAEGLTLIVEPVPTLEPFAVQV